MKKFLYLAMASVLLMACNNNDANGSYSKSDATVINQASTKVLASFGSSAEQLDADLVKLGFVKHEGSANNMPARFKMPSKMQLPAADDVEYAIYVYNIPEELLKGEVDENGAINVIVDSKKLVVELYVTFSGGKFVMVEGTGFINASVSGTVTRYENFSSNLYKSVPATAEIMWQGAISQSATIEEPVVYQEQAKFIADLSNAVYAQEYLQGRNADKQIMYQLGMMNPNDDMKKDMEKANTKPYCLYQFAIASY